VKNAVKEIGTCLYFPKKLGSFILGHYILEAYLSVRVYNIQSTHIFIYCCSVLIYLYLLHVTFICNENHTWCNVCMESEKCVCLCVCMCVLAPKLRSLSLCSGRNIPNISISHPRGRLVQAYRLWPISFCARSW
jgi:hypothetical protein